LRSGTFSDPRADCIFHRHLSEDVLTRSNCACRRACSKPYFVYDYGRLNAPSRYAGGNASDFGVADIEAFSRLKRFADGK